MSNRSGRVAFSRASGLLGAGLLLVLVGCSAGAATPSQAQTVAPTTAPAAATSAPAATDSQTPTSTPSAPTATPTSGPAGFSATGSLGQARSSHTATLLLDGRVLIAGGEDNSGLLIAAAEIYDPASGKFSQTGALVVPRKYHTATLLTDGRVLIAGGFVPGPSLATSPLASAELYDPATGKFSPTGTMQKPH